MDNEKNSSESLKGPPSPGRHPIQLQQCIEELLRYTIASSVAGNLEADIGLSDDFCANLLKGDSSNPTAPLYKTVAASLYQFISSGSIIRSDSEAMEMNKTCSLKREEEEFDFKLVREKGCELLNMLETTDFELHVQEPFFTYLKSGDKTIEGRCATDQYKKYYHYAYATMIICRSKFQDLHYYASFREMLEAEPLCKVLPGVETTEEGVQVYRNFYSEEKEMSNGVLAICVKKPMWQPYLSMASIISDLSLGGLQSLLDVYT